MKRQRASGVKNRLAVLCNTDQRGFGMDSVRLDRSKAANDHRLTSIREREKQKEAQKKLIRNALQDLDSSSNRNHVTFSDSDEDDSQIHKEVAIDGAQAAGDELLGFDGNDDINVTLEQRFKSKNTEKLLNLQSRYGNDSRFRLDDRFAESSGSSEEEEISATSEAKQNMHLIDQLTGHTAKSRKPRSAGTFSAKSSQRYDPSNSKNMELNMNKSKVQSQPAKRKKAPVVEIEVDIPSNPDRFYGVSTDILKNTFTSSQDMNSASQPSHTFSFLKALKLDPDVVEEDKTLPEEHIHQANNNSALHESSDDASSSDEEIPMIVAPPDSNDKDAKVPGFANSTFFPMSASDPLILEAAKTFCWNKTYDQMQKEWLEVKDILMKDYKKKHRDAKKKRTDD